MSNHEVLRQRSIEDIESASILMDNQKYDQAIELCHFAIEKIMKAALEKQELSYPFTHDLNLLANIKFQGRKFLLGRIKRNPTMLKYWELVHGRWNINLRYGFMNLDPLDYDELFEAYRGLVGWIRIQLVE